jgi:hypothetical protein
MWSQIYIPLKIIIISLFIHVWGVSFNCFSIAASIVADAGKAAGKKGDKGRKKAPSQPEHEVSCHAYEWVPISSCYEFYQSNG